MSGRPRNMARWQDKHNARMHHRAAARGQRANQRADITWYMRFAVSAITIIARRIQTNMSIAAKLNTMSLAAANAVFIGTIVEAVQ